MRGAQREGPEETVIRARRGWVALDLVELARYRDLLWFLVVRDVKLRYRQTVLGIAWVVLQPALTAAVFTGIFGGLVGAPARGAPYPAFVLAGILPWQFFAAAVAGAGSSLVASSNLVAKAYFPRLFVPLAACLAGLVDLLIGLLVLAAVLFAFRLAPEPAGLALAAASLALAVVAAAGCGLWFAALNVEFRDFRYVVPFVLHLGMFLTPVIYPVALVPERWRALLAVNPMAGPIEGLRAGLLGGDLPPGDLAVSATVGAALLLTGLTYFRRVERTFADVI